MHPSRTCSDRIDARKLSELLRSNLLRRVYHGEQGVRTLKELAPSYLTISKDLARVMSRLKAILLLQEPQRVKLLVVKLRRRRAPLSARRSWQTSTSMSQPAEPRRPPRFLPAMRELSAVCARTGSLSLPAGCTPSDAGNSLARRTACPLPL
jgi:hypothetical protein